MHDLQEPPRSPPGPYSASALHGQDEEALSERKGGSHENAPGSEVNPGRCCCWGGSADRGWRLGFGRCLGCGLQCLIGHCVFFHVASEFGELAGHRAGLLDRYEDTNGGLAADQLCADPRAVLRREAEALVMERSKGAAADHA